MSCYVKNHENIIPMEMRSLIAKRYHTITAAINKEFWDSESDEQHSFYVGSYGRGTAIKASDIDILVELPPLYYDKANSTLTDNGQSRLLAAVRIALLSPYPNSKVHADGQVVVINFSDGMRFEILPAFPKSNGTYIYPDTHHGGSWKSTNPKAEQKEMKSANTISNGLLFDTCKHMRWIRDNHFKNLHLSGIVIDSFVYAAINQWHWVRDDEEPAKIGSYELKLWEYFLSKVKGQWFIAAPGSCDIVALSSSTDCLEKVLEKMVGDEM